MKIALTGGSGRIGRAIADEALEQGLTVVSIDRAEPPEPDNREGITYISADMCDYEAMVEAFRGCDAVIHMGAIPAPGRNPDHEIHNNNVVGSYNALRAAAEHGIDRVCQASSVNAIGLAFSRQARFDYFPVDEDHPNYNEEPYSLSKWICEQQADSFVRRYETMRIASMRFHLVVPDRQTATGHYKEVNREPDKHLWAYTTFDAAARACLLSLTADFTGHEVFYIVASDTAIDDDSEEMARRHFPDVAITGDLGGNGTFFTSRKAERILGWKHDPD